MAGYSGTPLVKKLGFKPQMRCCFVKPPGNWNEIVGPLPGGVEVLKKPAAPFHLAVAFCVTRAELHAAFVQLRPLLAMDGMLWIGWPKKASGVKTELTDNLVREAGLKSKLVDVKVCAIDETWSGLKFVIPVALRG